MQTTNIDIKKCKNSVFLMAPTFLVLFELQMRHSVDCLSIRFCFVNIFQVPEIFAQKNDGLSECNANVRILFISLSECFFKVREIPKLAGRFTNKTKTFQITHVLYFLLRYSIWQNQFKNVSI